MMENVEVEINDSVATINLNKANGNSLTPDFIKDITNAHKELAENNSVKVVVLQSPPGSPFCTGFDTEVMIAAGADGIVEIFGSFLDMALTIYEFRKIEISAVGGHAIAAGAFLAITPDFVMMANKHARISFPEVHMGLDIPQGLMTLLECKVGPVSTSELVLLGNAVKDVDAIRLGLAQNSHAPDQLSGAAQKFARRIAKSNLSAMMGLKSGLRKINTELIRSQLEAVRGANGKTMAEVFAKALARVK